MAPASGRAQWRSRASAAKVEGDAGQRQAIGVVRGQGCAGWRPRRAVLNRRPIGRFFVVSIEEGSRKANRLPASGRARWPSAPGEGDADHRQPIGLLVVKGVPDGARVGPCSVAIAGERCQVEGDADHRQPIGLPVVKGVPDGARFGPCSVAIAG
jgi:hypothetical protein